MGVGVLTISSLSIIPPISNSMQRTATTYVYTIYPNAHKLYVIHIPCTIYIEELLPNVGCSVNSSPIEPDWKWHSDLARLKWEQNATASNGIRTRKHLFEHRHRPFRVNCENAIRGTSLDMKGLQYHFRHFLKCLTSSFIPPKISDTVKLKCLILSRFKV